MIIFEQIYKKIDPEINRPFLLAIDGVDCSGKTTFARKLADYLRSDGKQIIQAAIDGFHNPKEIRYRNGSTPEGYYRDSFNYDALKKDLLNPLKFSTERRYKTAVFDFKTESKIEQAWQTAPSDSILIFEGVFLHRPELVNFWDYSIFLDVSWETVIARAIKRDGYLFGSEAEIEKRYLEKYIPGQKLYLDESHPKEKADLVINNN
ncbi:hypothetical protein ACFLYJ_02510 [Candidatus Cloacimonadota bacterium]